MRTVLDASFSHTVCVGSFPRMRDRHRQVAYSELYRRFIPACAGRTGARGLASGLTGVHSRVYGTDRASRVAERLGKGSFPCVRDGLTANGMEADFVAGSFPRVRDGRRHRAGPCHRGRVIPACAGQTTTQWRLRLRRPVHSRVCGTNLQIIRGHRDGQGSFPRVRDRLEHGRSECRAEGVIPACAGQTAKRCNIFRRFWVHSRVRGTDDISPGVACTLAGSFPRARDRQVQLSTFKPILGAQKTIQALSSAEHEPSHAIRLAGAYPIEQHAAETRGVGDGYLTGVIHHVQDG